MLSLGIIPGTIINVLNSCGRMTIQVRSSQYAIGCEMADKIMAIPLCTVATAANLNLSLLSEY